MSQTICSDSLKKIVLIAGFLLSWFVGAQAQSPAVIQTVSPYSRFGLGDFQMNGALQNASMGGGGIGMRNDSLIPQYINFANPAAFSSHQIIAYEISLLSNTVKLQNSTSTGTFNRTTLGNFSLAFPVTKWWGAGFGLVPYSAVGYNVSSSDNVPGVGAVTYNYEGSGGINQAFLSNGVRPFAGATRHYQLSQKYETLRQSGDTIALHKALRRRTNLTNISIGVQTSYLFGSLNNIRRDIFPDSLYTFNTKITKRTLFHDVYMNYGIQYSFRLPKSLNPFYVALADSNVTHKSFFGNHFEYTQGGKTGSDNLFVHKPGLRVTVGLVFALPTDISVSNDLLAQTYKQIGTIEQFRDTIINQSSVSSVVRLPAMGGFGLSVKKDYKWLFQADYLAQMWSQASIGGVNYNLKNSQRLTAGLQFQPRQIGRGNYFGVVQYRLGARWYQTALELQSNQLTEKSVNFAMSLPVPYHTKLGEPASRATLNFEYGVRGTTDQNLIKEEFFRVTIGLTINDRWFSHYKYD